MPASSDFFYRFQSFWLEHKLQLRRWWVMLIIAIEALIFFVAVMMLFLMWADTSGLDQRLAHSLESLTSSAGLVHRQPEALTFGTPTVRQSSSTKADVYVVAKNPNPRWYVVGLRYRFHLGATVTAEREVNILPSSERYLVALSESITTPSIKASDVQVEVLATQWRYVQDPTIASQATFKTSNIQFTSVHVPAGDATRLTFQLATTGALTFRSVNLQIIALSGNSPIAFANQTIAHLGPTTPASVETSWLTTFPSDVTLATVVTLDPTDPTIVDR